MTLFIKKAEKDDLCQISLTGIRSLVLLGLLIKAPRSLEDIREAFIKYNIMDSSNSDDILRIDLNTLKTMGCEISRADRRTNNKFVLLNHPFKICITEEEISVLKRAYNKFKQTVDFETLIQFDELLKKVSDYMQDNDLKEELLGISSLKYFPKETLKALRSACENKNSVTIQFKKPTEKNAVELELVAEKVVLQNDKLYLYGVDKKTKESIYLNVKRILKLLSIKESDEDITAKTFTTKFYIKEFGVSGLDDCEKILSGSLQEGFIIEGQYHNEFYATQRILSFGSNCKIIEPESFKEKIVVILKKMRDIYNDK